MTLLSISQLKAAAREHPPVDGEIRAQIEKLTRKEASNGKPFYEAQFRDESDSMTLRAWADTEAFEACASMKEGDFVSLRGSFSHNAAFGLDARGWEAMILEEDLIETLLRGSEERIRLLERCESVIAEAVSGISDLRIRQLCELFLNQHGPRFRRAAAARGNHHARRGGLLEHTSRMMECALALCSVYPELNRDLVIAGVLFHDTGKLWETCTPERGFGIETELRGELLGHLSIGIELVNTLWRELPKSGWEALRPPSEEVRLHLLHLVASHHGQLEFGSPILPKTPEAAILHFIDNIDARMEMFFAAYAKVTGSRAEREWVRPLGVAPVPSLSKVEDLESVSAKITPFEENNPMLL
jgi:3'-5' exoribonuclease